MDKVQHSDNHIVQQCMNKSTREKGFRQLMSKYQERLYWHIRRMIKTHEDTDDVLQNTFIKVYRNLHNFKQNSSLHTWMYRIAYNESMNQLAKNGKIQFNYW